MKKLLIAIILGASLGFVCGVMVTRQSNNKQEDSKGMAKNVSKDTQANTEKEITINKAAVQKSITVIEGLTVVAGTTKCTQCGKQIKEGKKYYIINSKDICSKCFNK